MVDCLEGVQLTELVQDRLDRIDVLLERFHAWAEFGRVHVRLEVGVHVLNEVARGEEALVLDVLDEHLQSGSRVRMGADLDVGITDVHDQR